MIICFEKNETRCETFNTKFQKFPATALLTYQTKRHKMTAMLPNIYLFFTVHDRRFISKFNANLSINLAGFAKIKLLNIFSRYK